MIDQILTYVKAHPVISSVLIPMILGILASFISEAVKQLWFEDDPFTPRSKKVFRWITFLVALALAALALGTLWEWITDWSLRALFILLNSTVPFAFYHLKGREIVTLVITKIFNKAEKTEI